MEESAQALILLEDLSDSHSQPLQDSAPSLEQSIFAVEAMAKAHAAWWNDPQLNDGLGAPFGDDTLKDFVKNLEASVSKFLSYFSDLSPRQKESYSLLVRNADAIWGRIIRTEGRTITHGDCHWWNFLFPRDIGKDAVRVIDWHLWHADLGARDLAFLLALGGFAEPRPEIEELLLQKYFETLRSSGVSNYDRDSLYEDYRWSAIRNLNIPVIFWSQGKHESTVQTTLRRAFDAFERLSCRELFA